jgi:hypothetical protein
MPNIATLEAEGFLRRYELVTLVANGLVGKSETFVNDTINRPLMHGRSLLLASGLVVRPDAHQRLYVYAPELVTVLRKYYRVHNFGSPIDVVELVQFFLDAVIRRRGKDLALLKLRPGMEPSSKMRSRPRNDVVDLSSRRRGA